MFKLGIRKNQNTEAYQYANEYSVEKNINYERVIMGLTGEQIAAFLELTALLPEPFYLLYVLHMPRANNEPGRYQSKGMTYAEVAAIFKRYKDFLENDGRHDIWIHAPATNTTIVYDRHNCLYGYALTELQIQHIKKKLRLVERVSIPLPHVHNYQAKYDNEENTLIRAFEWRRTSLEKEDYN